MKTHPAVAVIMSVYKNDKLYLLKKALISIAEQTYPSKNVRIYLGIDGEVTQEMESVIADCNTIYKCLRNEKNIGLGPTLNKLVNMLEDEAFVFRMDADDVSLPNRFEAQINYMLANPKVDILGTAIIEVIESGEELGIRTYPRENVKEYIAKGVPVAHPTVCFRRNVFEKINYSPTIRLNEDIFLWFQALKNGFCIDNLPDVMYRFLVDGAFFKRRNYKKSIGEFCIYMKGIWALHKITWRYVFPIARLISRLLPEWMIKVVYRSEFRKRLLNDSGEVKT
jgi:hypothetical protein